MKWIAYLPVKMTSTRISFLVLIFSVLTSVKGTAKTWIPFNAGDSLEQKKIEGYQIHLTQPAKEIKLLLYEKNFLPVKGELSIDHRSIIMREYEAGSKVRVKVIYEDGTEDEFVRSSCYIDPVIL